MNHNKAYNSSLYHMSSFVPIKSLRHRENKELLKCAKQMHCRVSPNPSVAGFPMCHASSLRLIAVHASVTETRGQIAPGGIPLFSLFFKVCVCVCFHVCESVCVCQ